MRKALFWVAGAALLVSLFLPAYAQDAVLLRELTPTESKAISDKIASNWNIAADPANSCTKVLTFEIQFGMKGIVQDVVLIDPQSFEAADPCRSAVDNARRAILKSSPLPIFDDNGTLELKFDPSSMQ